MAGGAGGTWAAARSRARGSRSWFPCRCATTKPAERTDAQAALAAALCFALVASRPPDRPPGHPPCPMPGRWKPGYPKPRNPEVIAAARTPRQSLPFGQLGVTSLAEPPLLISCGRLRGALAPEEARAARAPCSPPQSPHGAPVPGEGDLWGDLSAVGQVTGSLLRLRGFPHPPPLPQGRGLARPPPARGRERGSPSERIGFEEPAPGSG
jgi:hypothetical protein